MNRGVVEGTEQWEALDTGILINIDTGMGFHLGFQVWGLHGIVDFGTWHHAWMAYGMVFSLHMYVCTDMSIATLAPIEVHLTLIFKHFGQPRQIDSSTPSTRVLHGHLVRIRVLELEIYKITY